MKGDKVDYPIIHIALVEEDPLRLVGFRSILDAVPGFRSTAMSVCEITANPSVNLALLGNYSGMKFVETMADLKAFCPQIRALVTGSGTDEETVLKALTCGPKGYVDEAAPTSHLAQAIYGVCGGSVWAPRRVVSMPVERSSDLVRRNFRPLGSSLTCREQQVVTMLSKRMYRN